MKLKKAVWDLLPDTLKKTFTQVGDTEDYDNGEEDVKGLKSALEREREEAKTLKEERKAIKDAADAAALEAAKAKGDTTALEASWAAKLARTEAAKDALLAKQTSQLRKVTLEAEARKLATEMSTHPDLIERFIMDRLDLNLDGDMPSIRVLDSTGKPSAATLADLKNEFVADKRFSGIVVASLASGGGAGGSGPGAGGFKIDTYRNADGSINWGLVNKDHTANPAANVLESVKVAAGLSPAAAQ
jgi:hypothetical protein